MRLWMDPEKLRAYGLSPLDVRAAVNRENIELPSGRIEGEPSSCRSRRCRASNTPAEFDALIIKRSGDSIVRFRDIGYAELGAQNERGALKMGDQPIAGLYFRQQPGANQIEIVDELRSRLEQIQQRGARRHQGRGRVRQHGVRAPLAARGDARRSSSRSRSSCSSCSRSCANGARR